MCLVAQSCLTLCNPMDCSPPGPSVHRDSPGKNTRVGCHTLLQDIFPTQGSNPGLPHCGQILYHLSTREALYVTPYDLNSIQIYIYICIKKKDQEKCSKSVLNNGYWWVTRLQSFHSMHFHFYTIQFSTMSLYYFCN